MGLAIYKEANQPGTIVNSTNPIETTHRGNIGDAFEVKLYLRNDEVTKFYESVTLTPLDRTFPDDTKGEAGTGWGVKLSAGDDQPTAAQWRLIRAGNTINLPNVGIEADTDTDSYLSFWYRIESPANIPVETKTDILLSLGFLEFSV